MSAISRVVHLHSLVEKRISVPRNRVIPGCNRVLRFAPCGFGRVQTIMCCDTSHDATQLMTQNACMNRSFYRRDSSYWTLLPAGVICFQNGQSPCHRLVAIRRCHRSGFHVNPCVQLDACRYQSKRTMVPRGVGHGANWLLVVGIRSKWGSRGFLGAKSANERTGTSHGFLLNCWRFQYRLGARCR